MTLLGLCRLKSSRPIFSKEINKKRSVVCVVFSPCHLVAVLVRSGTQHWVFSMEQATLISAILTQ